jgi:thermitase
MTVRGKRTASFRAKLAWLLVTIIFWGGAALAAMPDAAGGKAAKHEYGELIVKFRPGGEGRRDAFHRRHGSRRLKKFPAYAMERVKVRAGTPIAEAVHEFENDPEVEYAEPNYRVRAFATPADPSYAKLWGMAKINAPAAWNTSTGSREVVVAVIDSGIDYRHPDLADNLWTNLAELDGKTGVDDDGNGVVDDLHGFNAITGGGDPFDDVGHGTHVAGTIGAVGDNGVGVAGVNWSVRIMACKFLDASGEGFVADAIDCLHYVGEMKRRGVNVVATNNSWGGDDYSHALADAIDAQHDILFVTAAGNDGSNNDSTPSYPANYDLPNVIAVAATTNSDSLAYYSQYGRRTVHLGAPGSSIYSTYPGGGYATFSGTSMAAPHVTGLAALIKAARPATDWRGIRNLLFAGGDPLPSLADKTVTGRRINALGSLTCLDSRLFSPIHIPSQVQPGIPATLSALSIDCDLPLGPVTVTLSGGELVELKDDGIPPDLAAGDGVFTATFTPTRSAETFAFSSPPVGQLATLPPDTTITAEPPVVSNSATATFAFAATGNKPTFTCSLDGGGFTPCVSPYTTPHLADGLHTFSVRAVDLSGAVDPSPAGLTWAIDTVPPLLTLDGITTLTKETSQVINGTVEWGITPRISTPAPAVAGPVTVSGNNWSCKISGLAGGDHVITVQAVDVAGNATTIERTVRVVFPDGSFSGSGAVTLADALKALRIATGIISPTPEELLHGDVAPLVNGVPAPDGKIDINDVLLILRRVLNLQSF